MSVSQAQLADLSFADFSPSAAQEKFNIAGVAEPCALLVSGGKILIPKQSFERCTIAVALVGLSEQAEIAASDIIHQPESA